MRKPREADRLLAEGQGVPEVAKQLEVSEATYHRWRAPYGGLKADDVKLEAENARLNNTLCLVELRGLNPDPLHAIYGPTADHGRL
jgi:putative transposase